MRHAEEGRSDFFDRKEQQMKKDYHMELNGYSNFFTEVIRKPEVENFTINIVCAPYTYETCGSGLISAYSASEKKGFAIIVKKQGIITVKLGLENVLVEFDSLREHMNFQQMNSITFAFWGTAGWCDLYVNGKLSNRKQFPRHSRLLLPMENCFIGKYVDGKDFTEGTMRGVFHGRLDSIDWTKEYQNYQQILEQYQEPETLDSIDLYATQDFSRDIYRPLYHLIPLGKWMNEPHAPFCYNGKYHIFYQANPHAPIWDNLCWGHLVSCDMVKWEDAGIALYPDEEQIDIDGCWSGSACMNENGQPLLFYTAGNNKELPNQSVAVAHCVDIEDPMLTKWAKDGVVLQQKVTEGFLGEFRDPFVWRDKDIYYILVGSGDADNGGGNALLYTSIDLKHFTSHGYVVDYVYENCPEVGHVWELPVMLPLTNKQGEHTCDILLFCACQIEKEVVETYYFMGEFNYETRLFEKFHDTPKLIDLGNGTFTGPSGFVAPDGRSIVYTIAQGKKDPLEEYRSGWAHNGGLPIELWEENKELRIAPVSELEQYFAGECYDAKKCSMENLFQHRIFLKAEGNYAKLVLECEKDTYTVSYDRESAEWTVFSENQKKRISKIRGKEDLVDIGAENIEMECFIDHSMLEIYLNHRKSMTLRVYPFCEGNNWHVETDGSYTISVREYDRCK